jgi:hypothetical protein
MQSRPKSRSLPGPSFFAIDGLEMESLTRNLVCAEESMERSWISFEATFQEEFVWRNLLVLEEVHVWEHMRVVSRAQVVELEARLHMYNLEAAQRSGLLRAHKFAMKWVVCSAPVPCQKLTANPNLPMLARDAAANDSTIREPTGPQCIATQLSPVQGRPSAHISKSSFPFYNPVMFPPQIVKHSNGNGIAEHYLGAASRPSTSTADQTLSMAADLAADQTAPQGPSFSAKPTYQESPCIFSGVEAQCMYQNGKTQPPHSTKPKAHRGRNNGSAPRMNSSLKSSLPPYLLNA